MKLFSTLYFDFRTELLKEPSIEDDENDEHCAELSLIIDFSKTSPWLDYYGVNLSGEPFCLSSHYPNALKTYLWRRDEDIPF